MTMPTDHDKSAVRLAQALRAELERQQTPVFKDYLRLQATNAFARYQSYLAAGFNDSQAMQLTIMYKP